MNRIKKAVADGKNMIIHVVAQGETLNSIAARYNVSREQIIRDNQLRFPDQLVVGQTLVIL